MNGCTEREGQIDTFTQSVYIAKYMNYMFIYSAELF